MCSKHKTKGGVPMKDKFFIPGVIAGVLLLFSVLPRHCSASLDFFDGKTQGKGEFV